MRVGDGYCERASEGAALVGNAGTERAAECGKQSALLWLQCHLALVDARARVANASLTFKQAQEGGGT